MHQRGSNSSTAYINQIRARNFRNQVYTEKDYLEEKRNHELNEDFEKAVIKTKETKMKEYGEALRQQVILILRIKLSA